MDFNYHRQSDIFNPETVEQRTIVVIGCGTIGSFVVMGLRKLGVHDAILYDFDVVEDINIPSQNFTNDDIHGYKSEILGKRYEYSYDTGRFVYDASIMQNAIFLLCVDSLEARRDILASLPPHSDVIDGRMGGEGYEVHHGRADSINVPAEASEDLCTAKGIVYVSMGVAAEIVATVKRLVCNNPVDYRVRYRDYKMGDTLTIKQK